MIVGAQKAGTTSLKNYLNQHPNVVSHPQTEFSYFKDNEAYKAGYEQAFQQYFEQANRESIVAKNVSICSDEMAIQRLHEHNPNCQLVFLVRNPVERAYSSYNMEVTNGWLERDFSELQGILTRGDEQDLMYRLFIGLGLYSNHLAIMHRYFNPDNVHVIRFDTLKKEPIKVCQHLFQQLQLSPFEPETKTIHNKTQQVNSKLYSKVLMKLRNNNNPIKKAAKAMLPYKTFTRVGDTMIKMNRSNQTYAAMDEALRQQLLEYFLPYNEALEKLSGLDLADWNR